MSNRFSKPVAFNREKDKAILKHIARKNFSGYVKKLILADMEKTDKGPTKIPDKKKEPVKLSVADRLKQSKVFRPGGVNNG